MPTTHVRPHQAELLQSIADAISKARKIVVVTGAGISTNSGIPDFRSENGLYSLIQAQYDAAAAQQAKLDAVAPRPQQEESGDEFLDSQRPPKRRKLDAGEQAEQRSDHKPDQNPDQTGADQPEQGPVLDPAPTDPPPTAATTNDPPLFVTTGSTSMIPTSHPSVPEPLLGTPQAAPSPALPSVPPNALPLSGHATPKARMFRGIDLDVESSPLSSPPRCMDQSSLSLPSSITGGRRSSVTPSETSTDGTSSSGSQSDPAWSGSNSAAAAAARTVSTMKGKDLFDCSIWSDPLRTSVFYTFATTLRQKSRDVTPTDSHHFIANLRDRGKLVRCYTQNIDQLEGRVGLTTSLQEGPGSKGRFSRRSLAVDVVRGEPASQQSRDDPDAKAAAVTAPLPLPPPLLTQSSTMLSDFTDTESSSAPTPSSQEPADDSQPKRRAVDRGVECVFLHGSLELLRCFRCQLTVSWEEDERLQETLAGRQPECPHCVGATVAREERGKRALGVGKLRPDIVLYGEEHPQADLIGPIVKHDLNLVPDLMLILGTSLRVHGLKVMVREFARAVHEGRGVGGKVVFVNLTQPSESIWGDVIDYWVQWDCDAWVADLRERAPTLWGEPVADAPRNKKTKRESLATTKDKKKEEPAVTAEADAETQEDQISQPDVGTLQDRSSAQLPCGTIAQGTCTAAAVATSSTTTTTFVVLATSPLPTAPNLHESSTASTNPSQSRPKRQAATKRSKKGLLDETSSETPVLLTPPATGEAVVQAAVDAPGATSSSDPVSSPQSATVGQQSASVAEGLVAKEPSAGSKRKRVPNAPGEEGADAMAGVGTFVLAPPLDVLPELAISSNIGGSAFNSDLGLTNPSGGEPKPKKAKVSRKSGTMPPPHQAVPIRNTPLALLAEEAARQFALDAPVRTQSRKRRGGNKSEPKQLPKFLHDMSKVDCHAAWKISDGLARIGRRPAPVWDPKAHTATPVGGGVTGKPTSYVMSYTRYTTYEPLSAPVCQFLRPVAVRTAAMPTSRNTHTGFVGSMVAQQTPVESSFAGQMASTPRRRLIPPSAPPPQAHDTPMPAAPPSTPWSISNRHFSERELAVARILTEAFQSHLSHPTLLNAHNTQDHKLVLSKDGAAETRPSGPDSTGTILDSVKTNPRLRKRKKIDGVQVSFPTTRTTAPAPRAVRSSTAAVPRRPVPSALLPGPELATPRLRKHHVRRHSFDGSPPQPPPQSSAPPPAPERGRQLQGTPSEPRPLRSFSVSGRLGERDGEASSAEGTRRLLAERQPRGSEMLAAPRWILREKGRDLGIGRARMGSMPPLRRMGSTEAGEIVTFGAG